MNTEKKQNGLGIAGMILGIVAVVTSCFVLGGLFGTIGLILSIIALTNKNKKKGMAIAGIILNIIGIAIAMAVLISSVINNQSVAPSSISNEASVSTSTDEESTFDITGDFIRLVTGNLPEIVSVLYGTIECTVFNGKVDHCAFFHSYNNTGLFKSHKTLRNGEVIQTVVLFGIMNQHFT